ncbi:CHASE domain-containing protein [Hyalangium gracile]|uniref:CHASE domain-containing protein n=1 Tax=Hyalangium gracile TaxID=394092 RepID=UPI001CCC0442|nr:CHASE domain-containing protein [Hyalangium gracile]
MNAASLPPTKRIPLTALAVLVVALLLAAACTAFFLVTARSRDATRFEGQVQMTQDRIAAQLDADITLLRGAAGFFSASESVNPQEFRIYVQRLDVKRHDPGVQGLGFSQRILAREKEAWVSRLRAEGLADFHLWPEQAREEYHAIIYLEPLDERNEAALGYDMFTEPIRREAMERAWRTGEPALSGKVILKQEIDVRQQAGFLLYVPVYSSGPVPSSEAERMEKLVGFVYSPFRVKDLFDAMFPPDHQPRVFFRVYDGPEARAEQLLYDSADDDTEGQRASPRFTHTWHMERAGRVWTLVFTSRPSLERSMLTQWVPAVGVLCLLLSLMVFSVAWTQVTARQRAEANEEERARLLARQVQARREAEASREEARRSAEQLQTITDALPALVAYVDAEERYLFANQAYETWFGQKPAEVVGRSVRALIGEQAYARFRDPIQRALKGELVRYEGSLALKNGGTVYTASSYIPDRDAEGRVRGFVVLAPDITERKQAEEAARSAVRLRDEFLSVASHELKTPLTSLSLKLQTLARDAAAQPDSPFVLKVRAHVETGRRQVKRLSELIGDLLDVSRISSGKMKLHWEPVDFAAVVREVASRLEPEATRAESRLTVEAPETLPGSTDRLRFEQVVENLLTNAIKYGAGQPIHVRLEAGSERLILTVQDRGIGIALENQARIFERFERAVSERNYGGLGLGLYITRTILEALGGTIRVKSEPGQGACFTVELPREPPAP